MADWKIPKPNGGFEVERPNVPMFGMCDCQRSLKETPWSYPLEKSPFFSWENSLFRLGHGFNSYVTIYQRVTSFSKNSMASSPSMSIPPRCVALDLRPRYFEPGKYDVEMKDTATGLPFSKVPGRNRAELTDVPWLPWSSYMRYDIHPSQTGNHQNHHIMGVYIYIYNGISSYTS